MNKTIYIYYNILIILIFKYCIYIYKFFIYNIYIEKQLL